MPGTLAPAHRRVIGLACIQIPWLHDLATHVATPSWRALQGLASCFDSAPLAGREDNLPPVLYSDVALALQVDLLDSAAAPIKAI